MNAPIAPPTRSPQPLWLLSVAGFTILTTEFIIVGLLPPMARDLHVSISRAGLLVSLFALTVGVAGPLLTARLAHHDRKTLFVGTLGLFAGSNALAAAAPNLAVMAVARLVPALLLPVFWGLASETGVRLLGPARAGEAISRLNFGIVAATIFGIPVGTLISDRFGWRTAFATVAALAALKAAVLFFLLPALPGSRERVPVWRHLDILREPRMTCHVGLSLLVYAGMFTAYTYLADLLEKLGGFREAAAGWTLMGFGGAGLLGNWLGGRTVDRHPLWATVGFCGPLAVCLLLVTSVLRSPAGLAPLLAAWGVCHAALFTVSHTRVIKAAGSAPALGASLNVSGANFGIALGALLGGRVIDLAGLERVGPAAAALVALATATALFAIRHAGRRAILPGSSTPEPT